MPDEARFERGTTMMKTLWTSALPVVGTLMLATPAQTQTANCAPRDVVVERLASQYGETRQSIGLGHNNTVTEVYASTETGTWTIAVTNTRGLTCLVASGLAFETLSETLPVSTEDA
jgi:hypothetical protein